MSVFVLAGAAVLALAGPFLFLDNAAGTYTYATGITVLIVVGSDLVVSFVLSAAVYPRAVGMQRAELEAGYTTLMPGFDQVDGIDPKSGRVVRPAVPRQTALVRGDAITTGMDIASVDIGRSSLDIALRVRSVVIGFIASTVVMSFGSYWFVQLVHAHPDADTGYLVGVFFIAFAGFCGVLTIPILAIQFAPIYYCVALLGRRTPDTRAFRVQLSNNDTVTELVGVDAPSLPGARYFASCFIAFEPERLIMYSRHRRTLLPFLMVPRSRIAEARTGWVSNANLPVAAPVLTFVKDNGSHLVETLMMTPISTWGGRKQLSQQSQWVVEWALRSEGSRA